MQCVAAIGNIQSTFQCGGNQLSKKCQKYEGWVATTLLIKEQERSMSNNVAVVGEGSSSGSLAMAATSGRGDITSPHAEIDVPV